MAIGARRAAQRRGLSVGRDLAVTGFDDMDVDRYIQPALTSIRQPVWEIGQRLIRMMLEILRDEAPVRPDCVLLDPTLIVRASSQPELSSELDRELILP
jgi:DNA-binding LacI/PurR family transcriptional regulator